MSTHHHKYKHPLFAVALLLLLIGAFSYSNLQTGLFPDITFPKIKVIVTSAYPLDDQKRLIVKADDYFDKSHGTELLLAKIKNLLSTV